MLVHGPLLNRATAWNSFSSPAVYASLFPSASTTESVEDLDMSTPKAPAGHFTVLYFAAAASFAGKSYDHFAAPMDVTALFKHLNTVYPGMQEKILYSCALTVNLDYVDIETDNQVVVNEGDEVAVIPPVSSG